MIIEIPTGAKPTVASCRMEANKCARRQQHNEMDPNTDPYPQHKIPIPDVCTRSLVSCLVDAIQEDLGAGNLHWHGYKETWQLSRTLRFAFNFEVVIIRYDKMARDREIVHMIHTCVYIT